MVTTSADLLYEVKEKLIAHKVPIEESNLERIPKNYVECSEETIKANEALIEWLEDLDDVDAVYHNMQEQE